MGAVSTVLNPFAAIGGIASGIGGAISTKKTNQANFEIAQMNNEFNAAEAQKNRDFQLEMWNRNNEYNTPEAKRARLEAAGYSPYADMSGMSTVGGSVPSGSSASAAQSPTMQPMDFSDIGNAVSAAVDLAIKTKSTDAEVSNKNAQTQQIQIDNQTRAAENMARIDNLIKNSKYLKDKSIFQGIQNKYAEAQQINARTIETESIKNMQAARQQLYVQTALQSKELNGFDEKRKLELGLLSAQIFTQWQTGQLTFRQASTELVKQANIRQDTRLKTAQTSFTTSQDVEQKRATAYNRLSFTKENADLLLLQLKYQTERAYNNSGPDNWFQFGHANKKDGSYTGSGWYIDRSGKKILNWKP